MVAKRKQAATTSTNATTNVIEVPPKPKSRKKTVSQPVQPVQTENLTSPYMMAQPLNIAPVLAYPVSLPPPQHTHQYPNATLATTVAITNTISSVVSTVQPQQMSAFDSFGCEQVREELVIPTSTKTQVSSTEEKALVSEVSAQLELKRDIQIPDNVIAAKKQEINPCEFYLYHNLERNASTNKLTPTDQTRLLKNMQALDVEGGRIAFVIIRMYSLHHHHKGGATGGKSNSSLQQLNTLFEMPFQGKTVRTHTSQCFDIEFDTKQLPDKLQHMLLMFSEKHLETLICEQERNIQF